MSQDIYNFIEARIAEAREGTQGMRLRGIEHVNFMFDAIEAVLDFHKNWPVLVEKPAEIRKMESFKNITETLDSYRMEFVQEYDFLLGQEYMKIFGAEPPTTPMLRRIASIWASHPDFNPEWRLTREEFLKALGQQV